MALYINPAYDDIYGEADSQGLIDEMIYAAIENDEGWNEFKSITKEYSLKHGATIELIGNKQYTKITYFFIYLFDRAHKYNLNSHIQDKLEDIARKKKVHIKKPYLTGTMLEMILECIISEDYPVYSNTRGFAWPANFWLLEHHVDRLAKVKKTNLYPYMTTSKNITYFMNWAQKNPFSE